MEAKIKCIGTKMMVQTYSVEMCDFFHLFSGIQMNRLCVGEVLSKFPPPNARNLDPTKTAFSEFFFPKNAIDVSVTPPCVQKTTQITE